MDCEYASHPMTKNQIDTQINQMTQILGLDCSLYKTQAMCKKEFPTLSRTLGKKFTKSKSGLKYNSVPMILLDILSLHLEIDADADDDAVDQEQDSFQRYII
jgi:hypothetical protein